MFGGEENGYIPLKINLPSYISFLLMFIRKCHRNVTIISPIDAGKSFILFSRNTRTVNCWNKTGDIDYPKITFQPDLNLIPQICICDASRELLPYAQF